MSGQLTFTKNAHTTSANKGHNKPFQAGSTSDSLILVASLINEKEFGITGPFNERLNEVYRKLRGVFDREKKMWTFPMSEYQSLQKEAGALGLTNLKLDPIPSNMISCLKEPSADHFRRILLREDIPAEEAHKLLEGKLAQDFLGRMMPYQRIGVVAAHHLAGRVLLADEMGLGKTLQALAIVKLYQAEWPLLVVCPSSLRLTWAAEMEKWLDLHDVQVVSSSAPLTGRVCIVSYDLMTKMAPDAVGKFRVVIADEAHYLKDGTTKRVQAILPLLKAAKRLVLITGTPALSRPCELFNQIHAINPELFKTMMAFGRRYCAGHQGRFGWDFTGSSNLAELNTVLRNTFFIRRLKHDVMKQLPSKTRQQIIVEMSSKQKSVVTQLMKQYESLAAKIKHARGDERHALDLQRQTLMVKLYHETGSSKIEAACDYITEMLGKYCKVLVFGHHKDVLDAISAHLSKGQVRHIRVDGNTPQHLRTPHCDRFQTEEQCRAAVLSITAAGVGLTLHAANCVIFVELFWNPGQLLQAEDRAHRVGQQLNVDIKYLICPGTLDDTQWKLVQRKLAVVGQSVNGIKDTMHLGQKELSSNKTQLNPDDIECMEQLAHQLEEPVANEIKEGHHASSTISGATSAGIKHELEEEEDSFALAPHWEDDDVICIENDTKSRIPEAGTSNVPLAPCTSQSAAQQQKMTSFLQKKVIVMLCDVCGLDVDASAYDVHSKACLDTIASSINDDDWD